MGVAGGASHLCAGELCVVYAYDEAEEQGYEGEAGEEARVGRGLGVYGIDVV